MTASFYGTSGIPPEDGPYGPAASQVSVNPAIPNLAAGNVQDALSEHQGDIDGLNSNVAGLVSAIGTKQPLDATLTSIAALTVAANRILYTTGIDTFAAAPVTAQALDLFDDASFSAMRTTLGLAIGTDVQAYNAKLAALSGLTLAADVLPYATGVSSLATTAFPAFGRGLVGSADNAGFLTAAGLGNAANRAIGTSGATVPLLNGNNTHSGALAVSGAMTLSSSFTFQGNMPTWDIYELDGGTNTKRWRHVINGNIYALQMVDDAYSAATSVFSISRTAHTAAGFSFPSTTTVTLGGDVSFGAAINPATDNARDIGTTALRYRAAYIGDPHFFPASSKTPTVNGELVFEATSNTSLTIRLRGTDGTVRSVALTLAP